jgi:hypothetical protein
MCTEKHLLYSQIQIQKKKKKKKGDTRQTQYYKKTKCEIHTHGVCQTRTEKIVQC